MLKVFTSENRFDVQSVYDLLTEHRIPCFIKNEFAIGAVGELSPLDAWPEVWISDDEWQAKATEIVTKFQTEKAIIAQQGDWFCRACGEANAATFHICWQCGEDAAC